MVSKHYKSAAEISDLGKVQIARACGVAIVTNGNMYPTMELLLRHAQQEHGEQANDSQDQGHTNIATHRADSV